MAVNVNQLNYEKSLNGFSASNPGIYTSDGSLTKSQFLSRYAISGITADDIYNANSDQMIWHYRSIDIKFTSSETCTITKVQGQDARIITVKKVVQHYGNTPIGNSPEYKKLIDESNSINYDILNSAFIGNVLYDNTTGKFYEVTYKNKYEDPIYVSNSVNIATTYILYVGAKELPSENGATSEYITIGDYLKNLKPSDKIRGGLEIIIPIKSSGNTEVIDSKKEKPGIPELPINPLGSGDGDSGGTTGGSTVVAVGMPVLTANEVDYAGPKECFFSIYERGQLVAGPRYLPIFPNEISDRNSSSYNPTSILGRSVAYQTYNGSSRSVNLTLELHEELCDDYTYVPNLVKLIESVAYPGYETGQVNPCEMELVLGNFLRIRGIVSGVSTTWKAPIIDGRLVHCIVGFDITETTGPYSRAEVARMGAMR